VNQLTRELAAAHQALTESKGEGDALAKMATEKHNLEAEYYLLDERFKLQDLELN
jgi:hypothetical protein